MSDKNWLNSHAYERNAPADEVMSPRDRRMLQNDINKIIGTEADGTVRWRLEWGQDDELKVWDRFQQRWRHKYYWDDVEVIYQDKETGLFAPVRESIGIPRWFVAALIPRAARDFEAEAKGVDTEIRQDEGPVENGKFRTYTEKFHYTERRLVGEDYIQMLMVGRHTSILSKQGSPLCCEARAQDGVKCIGEYVEPGPLLLRHLRQTAASFDRRLRLDRRDKDAKQDAYREAVRFIQEEAARNQKMRDDLQRAYNLADFARIHAQGNPGAIKNHFFIPGL